MFAMSIQQAGENSLVAMSTLTARKTRSALTILGIVIGVASVISVAAIISGLNKFVQDRVESLGSRTYFVSRFPPATDPSRWPEYIRVRRYFDYGYAQYIRERCPDVDSVTTIGTRGFFFGDTNNISYGAQNVDKIIVRGAEPQYIKTLPLFSIDRGRFVTDFDEQHARSVVVLGAAISESLFPYGDPLGKTVRLNGSLYEVIGIFEHDQGLFVGPKVDDFAIMPMSSFKKAYPENKELIMAYTVAEGSSVDKAQDEVVQVMRRIRHVAPSADNDFEISSPDFISNLWNQLTGALVVLTTMESCIGLVIGGIGVMNIMLISVTERTQEIGVRKAIGARKADIRLQFLIEAVVLTLVGGTLGILIGAAVAFTVRALVPSVPATLSAVWVGIGFAISVAVGLFFGYYPANVAANLDPIVSLRYE
jgi:putative ABC transport system permease protein